MKRLAVTLLLFALPLPAAPVAVRAARMLDVRSGTVKPNPVVIVDDGHITALAAEVPAGMKVIELGDVTLLPGLMDMHTHLSVGRVPDSKPAETEQIEPADMAIQATVNARATLMAGFTTVRECGANNFIDVALERARQRDAILAPRIVPSGYQIGMTGGHADNTGYAEGVYELGPKQGVADGVPQVLFAVRYQIKHGAEVIKLMATSGVLDLQASATLREFSDEELKAACDEAKRHGLRVAAHAHGTEGILAAIRAGVSSIEHGSMLNDEAIRLMKEHNVFLVPTLYVTEPKPVTGRERALVRSKGEAMGRAARESFRKAIAAGVHIAFGTDAGVYPHGLNAREFSTMVSLGMKPADAIRSATLVAADLLGVDDRGEIAPGKLADLIAVRGNPLEDVKVLENVSWVMLGGRVVKE
jgi:imidazolonepropionase-like amidohydrolase